MLQHKFHCKRFFFSLSLNTPHTYCCCTSSIVKEFFFSFFKHTTHVLLLHKFYCKRFFFFSFSKHTTHIHLKFSTPSTLKPQRYKHIKIQNKTSFFQQFSRLLLFNSINCTTILLYKIFFSLSTSIPSGLNALSLLFNFSTFLLWKA